MEKSNLSSLAQQIDSCTRCDLYKSATHAVPGEGAKDAKIALVGEAPGFHEDAQGKPFVGAAGKYLDLLLSKIGLRREKVFITNVVKHRPPENRDPSLVEVAACSIWLDKQLEIISPKIIVTLGKWSLSRYLPNKKISQVHGQPFRVGQFVVLPMYHPAAALRNRTVARELEEDFLKNQKLLKDPESAGDTDDFMQEDSQESLF